MRRRDRQITDIETMVDILKRCDTIRLGLNGEDGPYVVPLSFGFEVVDGTVLIYIHGARGGLKHDLIARDPRVCVEADLCHGFIEVHDGITTLYESLIGFGLAEEVQGADKARGLDLLLEHCGFPGYACNAAMTAMTAVYRITLRQLTGKRNPAP